jgi:hypothetical protein
MAPRFVLGIDLGTSNSAVAFADLESDRTEVLEITQALGPNRIGEIATLPSALYIPHPEEFPEGAFALPWRTLARGEPIVGQFARDHGALAPDRLVASAKSWLSNPHIDAKARVLPWKSEIAEFKLSAFEAARLSLEHIKQSLSHTLASRGQTLDLADAEVVLTAPASFDEIARNLTAEAAEAAGFGKVVLLEEPLAAFYAWTAEAGRDWRAQVRRGDIVLVCDLGGGTADFSLVAIAERDGQLDLERISVGEHILLGGDNMDLALAYALRARLEADGKSLDAVQFLALTHAARAAKEAMFENADLAEFPIAVPSRGSSLFARTLSTALDRASLEKVVLDGFFAKTAAGEQPQKPRRAGLAEFGLPYASDPVVSKHLTRFLARSLENVEASEALRRLVGAEALAKPFLAPTAVLFNGGVFKAAPIRARVLDLLSSWSDGAPVRELEGDQPDLAVAKGAAVYGRIRVSGKGLRIKAGASRSYYIGIESSGLAVPGFTPPLKALCVVPQGMEEGTEATIQGRDLALVTGQPAEFRFFSSEVRSGDVAGQLVPDAERELAEISLIEVDLAAADDIPPGQAVPVEINAVVTELGTLELWMKHTQSERRWKVEFQVRTE